jgi:flagellar hook-associated protein 2
MTSVTSLSSADVTAEIQSVTARLDKPVTLLQDQQATDTAEISGWGTIMGTFSTLSTSLADLSDTSTIDNRGVTSSPTGIATATVSNTAAPGTYVLGGVTLAKMQEIYSSVQASASASLGSSAGSFSITLQSGKTETVSVGSGSMTLNGIAQAVNAVAGGVKATVVGTAAGARLEFQSSATGSSQAFSVSGTGALAQFDYASASAGAAGSMTVASKASDAAFTFNGVPITSTSNTITTAASGLSIVLAASGSTTLTVSSSPAALSGDLNTVTTNINAAIAAITAQTKFVAPTSDSSAAISSARSKSGVLTGNYTASGMSNTLLTAVSGAAASGMTSDTIGLTVTSTGTLAFNSTTFAAAYAQNPAAVTKVINQLYTSLNAATTTALGSSGTNGTIADQTTELSDASTALGTQITSITQVNDAQLSILSMEYTEAETAATNAQTTETFLSIFTGGSASSS